MEGKLRWKEHTLLQVELLDSRLVRRDSSTLNSHTVFLDRLRAINCNLIVRLIPILEPQVVVLEVDVQVRVDELVLDILPDDAGHLITIQLHHGVLHLDLLEGRHAALELRGEYANDSWVAGSVCEGRGGGESGEGAREVAP